MSKPEFKNPLQPKNIPGTKPHLILEDNRLFIGYEFTDLRCLKSWFVIKILYKWSAIKQIFNLLKKEFAGTKEAKKHYRMDLNLWETKTWFGYKYELFGMPAKYSLIWRKGKTPARYFIKPYQFEIR